mmetsp:Transcript_18159/g.55878  ORF Transcript_18159/g.55878 Transcript_18159/m.55878 type:complete len:213 (-) Transcript_18159:95-733(-)
MVATPPPPVEGDDAKKDGRPMGETVGLVFNVVGLLMGCLITITGLLQLIWASGWGDAQKALLGLYMIGFGLFAIILEVMEVKILIKWAPLMVTFWGRGLFYIFWGVLVAGAGGVAFAVLGIFCIVFGFLLIFIPPMVIKDYHLGPFYLKGDDRHDHKAFDVDKADSGQIKAAWEAEKKRADFAEARYVAAEQEVAGLKADLTLAENKVRAEP